MIHGFHKCNIISYFIRQSSEVCVCHGFGCVAWRGWRLYVCVNSGRGAEHLNLGGAVMAHAQEQGSGYELLVFWLLASNENTSMHYIAQVYSSSTPILFLLLIIARLDSYRSGLLPLNGFVLVALTRMSRPSTAASSGLLWSLLLNEITMRRRCSCHSVLARPWSVSMTAVGSLPDGRWISFLRWTATYDVVFGDILLGVYFKHQRHGWIFLLLVCTRVN